MILGKGLDSSMTHILYHSFWLPRVCSSYNGLRWSVGLCYISKFKASAHVLSAYRIPLVKANHCAKVNNNGTGKLILPTEGGTAKAVCGWKPFIDRYRI